MVQVSESTFIFADADDVDTGLENAEYVTPEDGQDSDATEPLEGGDDAVLTGDSV